MLAIGREGTELEKVTNQSGAWCWCPAEKKEKLARDLPFVSFFVTYLFDTVPLDEKKKCK